MYSMTPEEKEKAAEKFFRMEYGSMKDRKKSNQKPADHKIKAKKKRKAARASRKAGRS
jgi:hypothetical protein